MSAKGFRKPNTCQRIEEPQKNAKEETQSPKHYAWNQVDSRDYERGDAANGPSAICP